MNVVLETERLILRPIDAARDFEPWARTMADESTVRYLGSKPMNRALAWRNMVMVMGHSHPIICARATPLRPPALRWIMFSIRSAAST